MCGGRRTCVAENEPLDEARFVGAEDAARALGVSVATLYAYVGRKRIRTQRIAGSRRAQYWWPDIARVRDGETRSTQRTDSSGVTHESAITLMTQRGPFYRGRNALELAKTHALEAVASLLWDVDEADAFSPRAMAAPKELAGIQKLLRRFSPVDQATALFPILERANPKAFDLSRAGMARTGADLLRWYACLLLGAARPSAGPLHEALGKALRLNREMTDLVRCMLVLSADHGFEAGTYAVRACAAAGVTPYRSVLAGLAVVTGRRSNFGRAESVARLLKEIASDAAPERPIVRYLKEGEKLPGFGSAYYKSGDPRAVFLMQRYETLFGHEKEFKKLRKALRAAKEMCGLEPDFILANVYGYMRLGLTARQSLFPLGRSVGWIAHSIEQYEAGEMSRLSENYTGRLPG
jgi:citrate synthase